MDKTITMSDGAVILNFVAIFGIHCPPSK